MSTVTHSTRDVRALLARLDGEPADAIESEQFDCKEWVGATPSASEKMLRETVVCFANQSGGVIILGVADRKCTRAAAILGVPQDVDATRVRKLVYDGTDPHIQVEVEELLEPEGRLLLVRVPPGNPPYTTTEGLGKIRVGKECKPLTGSMRALLAKGLAPVQPPAETLQEKAERLARAEQAKYDRDAFIARSGLKLAESEALRIVDVAVGLAHKIPSIASERRDQRPWACFHCGAYTVGMGWVPPHYVNEVDKARFEVTLWDGHYPLDPGILFMRTGREPRPTTTRYRFDVTLTTHEPRWKPERSEHLLTAEDVAEGGLRQLLDYVEKMRGRKTPAGPSEPVRLRRVRRPRR
jgi:hypothetical protein